MLNLPIRAVIEKSADYVSRQPAASSRAGEPSRPPAVPESFASSLARAVDAVNQMLDPLDRSLQINLESSPGATTVKLVDRESGKVLRQIPSSEMLSIGRALDKVQGTLINVKA